MRDEAHAALGPARQLLPRAEVLGALDHSQPSSGTGRKEHQSTVGGNTVSLPGRGRGTGAGGGRTLACK